MKPTFDEAFKTPLAMLVLLRVGAYAVTAAIIVAGNGVELNPNANFTPGFMVETGLLYLIPLVAISLFRTPSIRSVAYSLVVAVLFGDFFWDVMQLAYVPLNYALIIDLVVAAGIPVLTSIGR